MFIIMLDENDLSFQQQHLYEKNVPQLYILVDQKSLNFKQIPH